MDFLIKLLTACILNKRTLGVVAFLVPSKKLRRKIRKKRKTLLECFYPEYDGLSDLIKMSEKGPLRIKKMFDAKTSITTLCLGSSHSVYSFNESRIPNAFNAGVACQDMRYSYEMYNKIQEKHNPPNVIVLFSIFSPGYELEKSSYRFFSASYSACWGIDYQLEENRKNFERLESLIRKVKVDDNTFSRPRSFMPKNTDMLNHRTDRHLKNYNRSDIGYYYLDKIANLAKKNGQNMLVVTAPVNSEYKSLVKDKVKFNLNEKDYKVIDFYNSTYFDDSDFGDYDHLNEQGADKFTRKIAEVLSLELV